MSRYSHGYEARDAYDEGYRAYYRDNRYDKYGPYEEEQRHRAYEDGYDDQRRERARREEREAEEQEEAARARARAEEAAYEYAMWEELARAEEPCPEPPEPGEEEG